MVLSHVDLANFHIKTFLQVLFQNHDDLVLSHVDLATLLLKTFLPVLSQNHDDLVLSHVDLAIFSYFENVIHSHEDLAMPSLAMLLG